MARRLDYLERFLGDMKEYAKAGAVERRRERLVGMVCEAQAMAVDALAKAGVEAGSIKVSINVPATLTVCVARYQVLLALVHVIKNAYEALLGSQGRQAESLLTIAATEATAGAVVLTIQDNANGIHPEDLEVLRAFAPGRRSQKPNGTGFGLPTAARYVAAQGGVLGLDSLPGEGTTVILTLPTSCEDEEA